MKVTFKSKMRFNAGSMITVIPSGLVKLLNVESGDELRWDADIKEDEIIVTVIPLKKEANPK